MNSISQFNPTALPLETAVDPRGLARRFCAKIYIFKALIRYPDTGVASPVHRMARSCEDLVGHAYEMSAVGATETRVHWPMTSALKKERIQLP
jgi:hypothetical protein